MTMNPLTEAIGISCGVGSSLKITKIKKCMKLNGISRRVGVLGKKSFLGGGGGMDGFLLELQMKNHSKTIKCAIHFLPVEGLG